MTLLDDPSIAAEQSKNDPAHAALQIIQEVMLRGSNKGGPHWRDETQDFHIRKAIRHAATYQLIRDGQQPPDGENHLELAITRFAMALACKE